jgi:hypothetical protein
MPKDVFVGVRDAQSTRLMNAPIGTGSCNQSGCHVTRPIALFD